MDLRKKKPVSKAPRHYIVTWVIDILDGLSPADAAQKALTIQRDPESIATVFMTREVAAKKVHNVDLNPGELVILVTDLTTDETVEVPKPCLKKKKS